LRDFAVLAFSLSYELDYLNLVAMLRSSKIPLAREARDESFPLLIAGGPCVIANPEPLASIVDVFAIGEGEVIVPELIEILTDATGQSREVLLKQLATVPGLYVPRYYQVRMDNDRILGITPVDGVTQTPQRQWMQDLDTHPACSVIITEDTEFGDMFLMEVARGCGRGCHFCLAAVAYSPVRERSLGQLLATAENGLKHRQTLGLIGASLSDYSHLDELVTGLRRMEAKLSVASLRVDPLPEILLKALSESGSRTVTIAPEAGSERLRSKVRKGISTEDIMRAAELLARYAFPHLKLYFMLGLPTEDDSDVQAIVELVGAVRQRFRRHITVNITPFVPKAQTAFQFAPMASRKVLTGRIQSVKNGLGPLEVEITAESPRWAEVQGVLARGDRLVGEALMVLEDASPSAWGRALEAVGLDAGRYLGNRSKDEVLPWQTISGNACATPQTAEIASQRAS
jgi:radical SAM superfamily enzyme YgiQ (UPF0313 family)